MNAGMRLVVPLSPSLTNRARMDDENLFRNDGIPKTLPSRAEDNSRWVREMDEKEAEESLALYCKPVEFYNIIQQRSEQQRLFLQRCLSYKIDAASRRRVRMSVFITGCAAGKAKARDAAAVDGPVDHVKHAVFVMVASPLSSSAEGHTSYRVRQARILKATEDNSSSPRSGAETGVSFILPELRLISQTAKNGDALLLFVCGSANVLPPGNGVDLDDLINCVHGPVLWGTMMISTLCSKWTRNFKGNGRKAGLLTEDGFDTTSAVDLEPGNLQHEDSLTGRNIRLSDMPEMTTPDRSLMQLKVRVVGEEVGRAILKGNRRNSKCPKSSPPFPLSSTFRTHLGRVVFHYLYYHGLLRKTEVTEGFSCPFCLVGCASFKGLCCHLTACHDLFEFECLPQVSDELPLVNVTCSRDDVMASPFTSAPNGVIGDVDVDPRLKNFFYWFKRSKAGRRKTPTSLGNLPIAEDVRVQETTTVDAACPMSLEQDCKSNHKVEGDYPAVKDLGAVATAVVVGEKIVDHVECSDAKSVHNEDVLDILSSVVHNEVTSHSEEEAGIEGDNNQICSENGEKIAAIQTQNTDRLEVVRQRRAAARKRQRMDGILGERTLGRNCQTPMFGGACASAGRQEDLDDCGVQQSFITTNVTINDRSDISHCHAVLQKRPYFHSHTAQPMDADQLFGDVDSEDEMDNVVADLEDRRMLDDFVDVSDAEKEVMHLWNSFVRRNGVVADSHCPWACGEFSKENAERFQSNASLRRCLVLFLVKLWNHHLVDGSTINRCLGIVDSYG